LHPACYVDRLPAGGVQRLGRSIRTVAGPADDVDGLVGRDFFAAHAELAKRDVLGTRRVTSDPLVRLPHVKQPPIGWYRGSPHLRNWLVHSGASFLYVRWLTDSDPALVKASLLGAPCPNTQVSRPDSGADGVGDVPRGDAQRLYQRSGFRKLTDRDWSPAQGLTLLAYGMRLSASS